MKKAIVSLSVLTILICGGMCSSKQAVEFNYELNRKSNIALLKNSTQKNTIYVSEDPGILPPK